MENINADAAFEQALDYLYSFINLEVQPQDRYAVAKLDLSRPSTFMQALGNPFAAFPAIHIAGTKGKGSVAAFCAYSLQAAGYKVGLYTSPHLQEFRERIRILTPTETDGRIPKPAFVSLMDQIKPVVDQMPGITWFEILTAVAFLHFAQQQVDIAVVEVGLGGRLDATNVITPLVSVITSLSIDHTKFLGDTLEQIAFEKAGIIKQGVPVLSAAQQPAAETVLRQIANQRQAPLAFVGQQWQYQGRQAQADTNSQQLIIHQSAAPEFIPPQTAFNLGLFGDFQLENSTLAIAALQTIRARFPRLTLAAIQAGLAQVVWHGRLQLIHQSPHHPTILADCAHNPDSIQKLGRTLTDHYNYNRLWVIFGCARDKDYEQELTSLASLATAVITTTVHHPRSAAPEELAAIVAKTGTAVYPTTDLATAVGLAWQLAHANDLICITGSIYVVGDLLNQWDSLQSHLIPTRIANPLDNG